MNDFLVMLLFVVLELAVFVGLLRRRRHVRRARRTRRDRSVPSAAPVARVRRQLRSAAPGAETLIVPDEFGVLSVDMIKEIAAAEGLSYHGGRRPTRHAPLHLSFRAPKVNTSSIVAEALAPAPVARAARPVTYAPRRVSPAADAVRRTEPRVTPAVDRLLNLVVVTGAVVVVTLGLMRVPEIRRDAGLVVPLLVVGVLAVAAFAWSVVRARAVWRLRAELVVNEERRAEHPLLAQLRTARPDRHGVLVVDLAEHADLAPAAIDDMVVTAGWDVLSAEERTLYLCRSRPSRPPVHFPDPPWHMPPGVQARYNWAGLFLIGGLSTLAGLGLFDDVRLGVAIGVPTTLVGIALLQWAGAVRRRRMR